MNPEIEITVLMPCYNAANYIAEAIRSVLNQTFKNFELLIINDGSSDDTAAVIRSFKDERIVLIEQPQLGVAAALNTGLQHARAEYIARFDADDICYKDRLEKQYRFMLSDPGYIIVGSAADYMDDYGNYIFTHLPKAFTDNEINALPFDVCPFIHASVMYKKKAIGAVGYNTHAHSFEDHLLWLQLKGTGKMLNMTDRFLSVRLNPSSLTMDEKKRPPEFRALKRKALKAKQINEAEGNRLAEIIRNQNNSPGKAGAYYSLLAKKFLWNNYNPAKARQNMKKAISINRFDIKDYLLLPVSYLPKKMIDYLYSTFTAGK